MRTSYRLGAVLTVLTGLALLLTGGARADDNISFKKKKEREKEFVTRVTAAVIKAARSKPQKVAVLKSEYVKPKANRTELVVKAEYFGAVTKKRYLADITFIIDSSDPDSWEVVNVRYSDNNPSPLGPNEKKIQQLIKEFNK
jgi:hypothetical protein